MADTERPRICFINTPGEITKAERGFANPLDISPDLPAVANVGIIDLTQTTEGVIGLTKRVADTIHPLLGDYDGFVVTGGRDNLHLIASRLAFAFGPSLDRTIAVAGTHIPAYYGHSGARVDLIKAAMVAATPFREAVVLYDNLITRGSNAELKAVGQSPLRSYIPYWPTDWGHLGEVTSLGVEVNYRRDFKPTEGTFINDFETDMAVIPLTPGLEPEFYVPATQGRQAVVIEGYGWGIPAREPYSFIPLIADLLRHNTPVIFTSRVRDTLIPDDEKLPGEAVMDSLGGVTGRLMTPEIATAKFSWVVRRVNNEITDGHLPEKNKLPRVKELMKRPYVGEFGIYKPFSE